MAQRKGKSLLTELFVGLLTAYGMLKIILLVAIVILLFVFVKPTVAKIACQHEIDDRTDSFKKAFLDNNNPVSNMAKQLEAMKAAESGTFQECLHRWGE